MPFVYVNNTEIYYTQAGTQGLPVVFVHGAAGSHLHWSNQVRALGAIARAVALDLPGHGRSAQPGRASVEAYCDLVLGLLDALEFERAVIVGHSMGGAIAQTLALTHPDRVTGLGLVGTGARLRVLPAILDGVLRDVNATARLVVGNSYAADLTDALRARAEAEFAACPATVTHADFAACNQFDLIARVAEIHAPTLVVCGKQDQMTPLKYSEFLAAQIPGARLVLVDHAGHSVMLEQAQAVNVAFAEFVSSLAA